MQLRDVSHVYNHGQRNAYLALDRANLEVSPGEVVSLIGQSGSGKTTLMLVAGLLMQPTGGDVTISGQSAAMLGARLRKQMRRRYIGIISQRGGLVPQWTALENVLYMARQTGHKLRKKQAKELLASLGLRDSAMKSLPSALSGGEYQRVVIAMAIAKQPKVILADEPTSALDSHTTQVVMDELVRQKPPETALLIVSHNEQLVWERSHKVYQIVDGRLSPPNERSRAVPEGYSPAS